MRSMRFSSTISAEYVIPSAEEREESGRGARRAAALARRAHRPQLIDDFLLARKAPFVLLGKDRLVVGRDDEDPAAAANELAVDSQFLLDLSRQTGGSGKVVSDAAVIDSDFHQIVFTRIAVMLSRPPRSFAVSI